MSVVVKSITRNRTMLAKDGDGFERIVAGEMLVPNQPDVYGDIFSEQQIRKFAYQFMVAGVNAGYKAVGDSIGLDVDHDNVDCTGKYFIVESYIAQDNDPHFTKGSWVIVSWIPDDDLWGRVLDGELVGYSYEAFTFSQEVTLYGDFDVYASGTTEPDPFDGHTHTYFCILDDTGRVVYGGTSDDSGHKHEITRHSVTEEAFLHVHRFNLTKSN